MDNTLDVRRQALEENFFARQEAERLDQYRQQKKVAELKGTIRNVTGIDNEALLQQLVDQGVTAETLTALSLIPLVEVAWADGSMDGNERAAVLEAASQAGIAEDSASAKMLEAWLKHPPHLELLNAWKDYVRELRKNLQDDLAAELRDEVLGRAARVAEAAGGILGFGTISQVEKAKLAELAAAFD